MSSTSTFSQTLSTSPGKRRRKLVLMGFRGVGKSTITISFVENQFLDAYSPTIENTHIKTIKKGGQEYELELVDTSGQDEFSIFQSQYAIGIHGYVLVYSVNNRQSFDMVQIINDKILNAVGADAVPRLLVGNKSDLPDRVISTEQGKALAERWQCGFVESSAKMNQNIVQIFSSILDEIEKDEAPPAVPKSTCSIV